MNLQPNYNNQREAFSISQESSNLLDVTRKDSCDSWGNAISGIGAGVEIAIELNSNNFGEASKDIGFKVAGILVNKGLNMVIPGSGSLITKKGKDIGKEILIQGGRLKVIGLEKVVDAATNKSKQNKN